MILAWSSCREQCSGGPNVFITRTPLPRNVLYARVIFFDNSWPCPNLGELVTEQHCILYNFFLKRRHVIVHRFISSSRGDTRKPVDSFVGAVATEVTMKIGLKLFRAISSTASRLMHLYI